MSGFPIQRKTPMNRGSSQLARTPLRKVSKKRRKQTVERNDVRMEVLARDCTCRAKYIAPGPCGDIPGRLPLEVHELVPRSVWPAGWLVADNCIALCPVHHDWVTDHPHQAAVLGLHRYSWDDPSRGDCST